MNRSEIDELLVQANSALHNGDTIHARDYASKAAQLNPQSEQAWLILASLSDPEQALLFIENALRANPRSQAARKAIRLVYRQMEEEEKHPQSGKPVQQLNETSPLPVPVSDIPVVEKESQGQSPGIQPEAGNLGPVSTEKKERFLQNLRKKTAPTEPASPVSSSNIRLIKKTAPHVRLVLSTVKPKAEPAILPDQIPPTRGEMTPGDAVIKPELQEEVEKRAPSSEMITAGQADSPKTKSGKSTRQRKAPGAVSGTRKKRIAPPKPEITHPKPKLGKRTSQETLNEAEPMPLMRQKPAKQNKRKRKQRELLNGESIELILVTIAAILIPLLVFVYFYLTR